VAPERVIRTYLVLAGLYTLSASLIWGVNTLFLLDAGLDIAQVFVANAAYTAGMVLFEIPTGVVADTLGRRMSFLVSIAVLLGSTLLYVVAGVAEAGLGTFIGVSVLIGLGYTFYSGATEAWLVDALRGSGYDGELDRVFSRGQAVTAAAMLVGTLSGGFLGMIDLSVPFLARAGLLVPVFAIAWATMHDVGFDRRPLTRATFAGELRSVTRSSVRYGLHDRRVRLLILVPFFQYGFFVWGWYAWQPYFLELLDRDEIWVAGVISAVLSLAMIVGNSLVGRFSRACARRTTIIFWAAAVQTVAAVGVGLFTEFYAAAGMLVIFSVAMGVLGPVKQAYLHESIPSEQRATLVSFDSLVGNLGSVGGQVGLGQVSRARGIADGYVLGGAATILVLPIVALLRRLGGPADRIVGDHGGKDAPCAAQGLPAVAAVDATPHTSGDEAA
jgi:MFS family permease